MYRGKDGRRKGKKRKQGESTAAVVRIRNGDAEKDKKKDPSLGMKKKGELSPLNKCWH